jgi:hypothetical protein
MPFLLYGLGALCVVVGLIVAWLGFPDREFSFGNTLIVTGTMVGVGGLILFALGVVVSRLQQLLDAGVGQGTTHPHRPLESFEGAPPARISAGRIPFPPKPKIEPRPAAASAEIPSKSAAVLPVVPTLPNPDEPPPRVADELAPPPLAEPRVPENLPEEPKLGPQKEAEEELPPADRRSAFDFAWPDHRKEDIPPSDLPPEPEAVAPAPEPDLEPEPSTPAGPQPVEHPRDVAVLKSGVVDGMGYTLYVDGSIEAELPQGTLRFASINELRQHLEQNT